MSETGYLCKGRSSTAADGNNAPRSIDGHGIDRSAGQSGQAIRPESIVQHSIRTVPGDVDPISASVAANKYLIIGLYGHSIGLYGCRNDQVTGGTKTEIQRSVRRQPHQYGLAS